MVDDLSNIIHSLPVVAHSVALSTRAPSNHLYPQKSMYTPDYGGILETPTSKLKNNALASGLPFKSKSNSIRLLEDNELSSGNGSNLEVVTNDCIIATSYLQTINENGFSVIRAIGKNLYLGAIVKQPDQAPSKSHYAHIDCKDNIIGLKHSENLMGLLLVKFSSSVKTFKLDESFQFDQDFYNDNTKCDSEKPALTLYNTIKERSGSSVKDSCINRFNKSIQAVASDNLTSRRVDLFDLSSNTPRKSFHTITWTTNQSDTAIEESSDKTLRNRIIRTFAPSKLSEYGIQQIDNIPSHLINMLVTTDFQTLLIDPRLDKPGQIYVDKTRIDSFYPIEFIKRTEFSRRNSHQFYSLSNVHLRVFDTRYVGVPMNQMNHMLDSSTYDAMNLKLIDYEQENLETLCSSSSSRLCFATFDQSQKRNLINPKSVHLPYHDSNALDSALDKSPGEMFGLGVIVDKSNSNDVFSILQLTREGQICMKEFVPYEEDLNTEPEGRADLILQRARSFDVVRSDRGSLKRRLRERDCLESEFVPSEIEYINITDKNVPDNLEKLESNRALERFEKLKNKLERMKNV